MNTPGILRTLFALAAFAGGNIGTAPAQSVTITFSAQAPGSGLGGSDGTELPIESLVLFGYFSIPFDDVKAGLGAPSLLETSFIQLAATRVGYFGGATLLDENGDVQSHIEPHSPYDEAPGLFGHDVSYDPEALGLLTTRFYLWVFNTPEAENATEFGLFSDSDWFSPQNTPSGSETYDVWTVDPNNPADLYHADRGPEQSSVPGFGPLNKLRPIPVPEPHMPALLLAAVGVLVWRRRRQIPLDS